MNLIIFFLSIIISSISLSTATNSLSMELIHRHDQFHTPENRLLDRLESDILRVNALSASGPLSSGLALGRLEYVVSVSIGTPPKQVNLALDTGNSVTWLQCRPCNNCYNQTDPSKSTSFSPLQCGDPLCKQLYDSDSSDCSNNRNPCLYNQTYGDGWFTSGEFSTEMLTFGNSRAVGKIALGSGHDNEGPFDESDGLLALGRGDLSFATQTGDRFGWKFSYCLSSLTADNTSNSSSIEFGDSAVPPEANFTGLLRNPVYQGYYMGFDGFSVDGKCVSDVNSSVFEMKGNGEGGVGVDALTAFSWVTRPAYEPLRDAFRRAFGNNNVMIDTPYGLDTCYNLTGMEDSVSVPTVKLHFDGADVELPVENYFILMDNNRTYCLGFGVNGNSGLSIFGNIVQQGFRVSFDLDNNLLGFTANAC